VTGRPKLPRRPRRPGTVAVAGLAALAVGGVLAYPLAHGAPVRVAAPAPASSTIPATTVTAPGPVRSPPVAKVVADMTEPNTVHPAGVPPSYSWWAGPEVAAGSTPPAGYDSLTGWGNVYAAAGRPAAPGALVELRDEQTWIFSRSLRRWIEVQSSERPGGVLDSESVDNDVSYPATVRVEPDGGVAVRMVPGLAFQFWPSGPRPTIAPSDVDGVFTTVQARVIPADPSAPGRSLGASFVVDTGGDYWRSPTAPWPDNAGIFDGRFDVVTAQWQSISMSSWTTARFEADPPPLAPTG
jgi:hypothetical protein